MIAHLSSLSIQTGANCCLKSPPIPEANYFFPMHGGLIACFAGRKNEKILEKSSLIICIK
jgi:hypothetical protein